MKLLFLLIAMTVWRCPDPHEGEVYVEIYAIERTVTGCKYYFDPIPPQQLISTKYYERACGTWHVGDKFWVRL
jgi:hypothetical protein